MQRFDDQRFVSEDVWFACVCETWVERSTSRYMEIHLPSERENDFACGASVKRWFNENLYSTPTTRKENHGLACKIHSRVFHIFGTGLMRAVYMSYAQTRSKQQILDIIALLQGSQAGSYGVCAER